MQRKTTKESKIVLIIGILIILFGISLISYKVYEKYNIEVKENELIEDFFVEEETIEEEVIIEEIKEDKSKQTISYSMILEIPKINLKKGISEKDSKYNSVKYGIQLLKQSNMPDVENGNVILASHRGNSAVSYFNKLNKVVNGDKVYLYYAGYKYTYEIVNIYEVPKTGTVSLYRDTSKNTITLITCKSREQKQLVFIGNLINKESY